MLNLTIVLFDNGNLDVFDRNAWSSNSRGTLCAVRISTQLKLKDISLIINGILIGIHVPADFKTSFSKGTSTAQMNKLQK